MGGGGLMPKNVLERLNHFLNLVSLVYFQETKFIARIDMLGAF